MRRLTLVLSDLYLPEDPPDKERPSMHAMPAFESLLRVADRPTRLADWRSALLAQCAGDLAGRPLADACAHALGLRSEAAWLATPVHLEARLDHVRLSDRGLLQIGAEDRERCRTEFDQVFGPQYRIHECGSRAFLLTGLAPHTVATRDPARWLGSEIGPHLPGADAAELRRLWAEIEMWLHGSALNATRERARRRPISALWLWGRESARRTPSAAGDAPAEFYGRDPLIESLSRRAGMTPRCVSSFAELQGTHRGEEAIVEVAPLTGDENEALPALESNWFAPARSALDRGSLAELTVVANDRSFRIGRRARWRLWRRRRHWFERLATKA